MNWVETIALLRQAGFKQPQIAALCKCSQSTISDIATGQIKNPRYEIGEALQRLAVKARRKLAREVA